MTLKTTPGKLLQTSSVNTPWKEKSIPFLGGRPIRDTIITSDDIMNLIIACHTCRNLDEFFSVT